MHARWNTCGTRLYRLRTADLAAIDGDRRVVRHVLRLERRDLHASPHQRARQPRHQRRLAGVRAGRLDHQRGSGAKHCYPIRKHALFRTACNASRSQMCNCTSGNPEMVEGRFRVRTFGALRNDGEGFVAADQNSTPFWPFTPCRKGCFTSVISVTRSAISISSGFALRPVMTTCLSAGFSSRRNVRTSSSGR